MWKQHEIVSCLEANQITHTLSRTEVAHKEPWYKDVTENRTGETQNTIKQEKKILKAEETNSISFPNKSITSCEAFVKLLYFTINTMEIIFPAVITSLKTLNSWLFVEKSITEKGDGDIWKVWALRTSTFCKWSFNFNLHYYAAIRFKACSLTYGMKKYAFCFGKQAGEE